MGNQCCGQPAESNNNFEVKDDKGSEKSKNRATMQQNSLDKSLRLSNHAQKNDNLERKIEAVNEEELEYKNDFNLGEGATYTGQMI